MVVEFPTESNQPACIHKRTSEHSKRSLRPSTSLELRSPNKNVTVDDDAFVIEERRRRDCFLELQTDDCLWANMIQASYDLKLMDWEKVNDSILMDLLKAGVYNWEKPNDRLHQSTQAIWHSTAIHMRMLAKHMQLEDKVRLSSCLSCCGDKLINVSEG